MVKLSTIKQSNGGFAKEHDEGLVCVFVGSTSGTGAGTLLYMALTLQNSPIFYVVGRCENRFAKLRRRIEYLNPSCTLHFVEAQVSLLADIDVISDTITRLEAKVDFLYMSAGMIPFNNPTYTQEGLETCFAISYYSRMRLIHNLLPLLRQSKRPRVLNILNAGREKKLIELDIGLKTHWSTLNVINHTTTMTTLAHHHLSQHDEKICFMHAYPGFVRSSNFVVLKAPENSSWLWKLTLGVIRRLVLIMQRLFGRSIESVGERQAYHLTSDAFGAGSWLVDQLSNEIPLNSIIEGYLDIGWAKRTWEHTVDVFDKTLVLS